MYVCTDCRVGGKGIYPLCLRDEHNVLCFGRKITVPKKNNTRAWKRIEKGETLWDRRKPRRNWRYRNLSDTTTKFSFEEELVELSSGRTVKRRRLIPGSGREVTNFRRKPHEVDLGG